MADHSPMWAVPAAAFACGVALALLACPPPSLAELGFVSCKVDML